MAAVCVLGLPQNAAAKDKKHHKGDQYVARSSHRGGVYYSRPRSSFTLSLGTGYAGRGYYWGPSGSSYYYERPGVQYYRERSAVPREYYGGGYGNYRSNGTDAAVQQALARRGYYRGPIDGDIGPGSRNAIARYQEDHGLRVTGNINSSLVHSLGL